MTALKLWKCRHELEKVLIIFPFFVYLYITLALNLPFIFIINAVTNFFGFFNLPLFNSYFLSRVDFNFSLRTILNLPSSSLSLSKFTWGRQLLINVSQVYHFTVLGWANHHRHGTQLLLPKFRVRNSVYIEHL